MSAGRKRPVKKGHSKKSELSNPTQANGSAPAATADQRAPDLANALGRETAETPVLMPLDRVASYLAEVREVERQKWESLGDNHWISALTHWTDNKDKLDAIKSRHGFKPDDPLICSITAFFRERDQILADCRAEQKTRGWPVDLNHPEFLASVSRKAWYNYLHNLCISRHFPRRTEDGMFFETPGDLWAYIRWGPREDRFLFGRDEPRVRPQMCPDDVERVYGLMHALRVPGVPRPPYPCFTSSEATHELNRIAGELERFDRAEFDRALTEEEIRATGPSNTVPAVADQAQLAELLAFIKQRHQEVSSSGKEKPREYTLGEAAGRAAVTKPRICQLIKAGLIKSHGSGRAHRVDGHSLDRWIADRHQSENQPESDAQAERTARDAKRR